MGSPLGVTFANFYMCSIENRIMSNPQLKPAVYARYVDDCFILCNSASEIQPLIQKFEELSVLTFTHEIGNKQLNFLDVDIKINNNGSFDTKTFRKPTDPGIYLNAASECPERYKEGTIMALINRSYKTCSNGTNFQDEMKKLKQTFVNNGYKNSAFDKVLNKFLDKVPNTEPPPDPDPAGQVIEVFYKNQYSDSYKTDEKVLKEIVYNNVKCTRETDKLKLTIYYKSNAVKSIVSKNNRNTPPAPLQQCNLVYEFKCNQDGREHLPNSSYIGFTTTSLSRRLTMHLASGAIKDHCNQSHGCIITREQIVANTKIIRKEQDENRLQITEAILIQSWNPALNRQSTGRTRTLKLFSLPIVTPDMPP